MEMTGERGGRSQVRRSGDWRTITIIGAALGYSVHETTWQRRQERLCERVILLVGVAIILVGLAHWFVPGVTVLDGSLNKRLLLTAMLLVGGGVFYRYATCGFRRALHIDLSTRNIVSAQLNSKNQCSHSRKIPMHEIYSIYIRRSCADQVQASLNIRLKSQNQPIELLNGEQEELETLHEWLCADIKTALECGPKRVRKGFARKARPQARGPFRRCA